MFFHQMSIALQYPRTRSYPILSVIFGSCAAFQIEGIEGGNAAEPPDGGSGEERARMRKSLVSGISYIFDNVAALPGSPSLLVRTSSQSDHRVPPENAPTLRTLCQIRPSIGRSIKASEILVRLKIIVRIQVQHLSISSSWTIELRVDQNLWAILFRYVRFASPAFQLIWFCPRHTHHSSLLCPSTAYPPALSRSALLYRDRSAPGLVRPSSNLTSRISRTVLWACATPPNPIFSYCTCSCRNAFSRHRVLQELRILVCFGGSGAWGLWGVAMDEASQLVSLGVGKRGKIYASWTGEWHALRLCVYLSRPVL
jgi:hypothetical protein